MGRATLCPVCKDPICPASSGIGHVPSVQAQLVARVHPTHHSTPLGYFRAVDMRAVGEPPLVPSWDALREEAALCPFLHRLFADADAAWRQRGLGSEQDLIGATRRAALALSRALRETQARLGWVLAHLPRPSYNHTRDDSPLTPCPACAVLANPMAGEVLATTAARQRLVIEQASLAGRLMAVGMEDEGLAAFAEAERLAGLAGRR